MASNTVDASNAGVGSGAITGYAVSNISYALVTNALTPGGTYIQQVNFTLTPGCGERDERALALVRGLEQQLRQWLLRLHPDRWQCHGEQLELPEPECHQRLIQWAGDRGTQLHSSCTSRQRR